MKRYLIEMSVALAAYAALLAFSLHFLAGSGEMTAARTVVTLLPMLPGLVLCAVIVRSLRRLDEMQRRLQLEALALAFAGTAIVTFSYGFLENVGFPRISMFAVWPLMAALWLVGTAIGRWRYR